MLEALDETISLSGAGPVASSQAREGVGNLLNERSKHVLQLPLLWMLRDRADVTHSTHDVAPVDSLNIQSKTLCQFELHHLHSQSHAVIHSFSLIHHSTQLQSKREKVQPV